MSSQQKKQQQTLTQTASYNTAVIATVLSGVHTVLTWYQCTQGVMETSAGPAIRRAKSAIGSAATGAKTAIGRLKRTPAPDTSALGGGAKQGWAYGTWYWRVSISVLLLIFILSIFSHRYVEQHPEDTNPNSWADTFYTCILSILSVLVAVTLSALHTSESHAVNLNCDSIYKFIKIGLLLLLTFFTGAVAADRQAHKTA